MPISRPDNAQPAVLSLRDICKSYTSRLNGKAEQTEVLRRVSLEVSGGEVVALFGPNGCGKTTLLNIISGLVPADSGEKIIPDGVSLGSQISFVFQNYRESLFPWMNALDNVAFPLALQGTALQRRRDVARSTIESLGLPLPLESMPYQLSGGQQQMVAIARALVVKPHLLLLDEPFTALDYETRLKLQVALGNILSELRVPTVLVSHDVDQATFLADRVVVLTRRPATIAGEVLVGIPSPRSVSTMETPLFSEKRSAVLSLFRKVAMNEGG
jgi:NitT/TauT family transport system ATP-binding protein